MPGAPRTDPYVRNYLIRLLPRVVDAKLLHVSYQARSMLPPVSAYRSQTSLPEFPLVTGLPSGTSATAWETTPCCSAPSSVLRRCQTARRRARKDCGHGPSLTVPPNLPTGTAKLSRFSNIERPRMLRVSDSAGPGHDSPKSLVASRIAFPIVARGRRPGWVISERSGWPALPLSTLHVRPHDRPRMTRGRDGAAPPFTWGSFIPCSMPVYPGAHYVPHRSFVAAN